MHIIRLRNSNYGNIYKERLGGVDMKKLEKIHKVVYMTFITAGLSLLGGCVVYQYTPEALSVPQIVQMSKEGKSSKDIIKDIRQSHITYNLKASDFADLRSEGVQDSVLNYMDKTRINSIRDNERYQNYAYWGSGWGDYWYGGPGFGWYYPYWGYDTGPTVIIRGSGGHHEDFDHDRR